MKNIWRRVLAAFCCVLILCSMVLSVSAVDYVSASSIWSWLASHGGVLQSVAGYITSSGCSGSEDGRHHASSISQDNGDGSYDCLCSYCGQRFPVYESDLQSAYNSYVDSLPASGYGSDGSLLWSPHFTYFFNYSKDAFGDLDGTDYTHHAGFSSSVSSVGGFTQLSLIAKSGSGKLATYYLIPAVNTSFPISGFYSCSQSELNYTCSIIDGKGVSDEKTGISSRLISGGYLKSALGYHIASDPLSFNVDSCNIPTGSNSGNLSFIKLLVQNVVFHIVPSEGLDDIGYNLNSRTGSITGGLGIYGEGGVLNKIENNYVFNEENNTYYNPTTNVFNTVNEWYYDYSDRSYHLTLDTGDIVTVTYGDQYITVQEGDTVYNIYYIIDGSAADHQHHYSSAITVSPSCTALGTMTYTCMICGVSYTESIPMISHSWDKIEDVDPEYDDEGNLIAEGYTRYRCSVCNEEYNDYTGVGPPLVEPSDAGWLERIYNKLCEILEAIFGLNISQNQYEIDIDIGSEGEDNETKQRNWFGDLLSKFGFLSDLSAVYKQLVADVTSDAETASLLADGTISIDVVDTGHAVVLSNYRGEPVMMTRPYTVPELAVSFGSSDKYGVDWAGVKPLDLSWYAPYKETVDGIASGFLWLGYIFLLLKRVPEIIRGSGMITEDSARIDDYKAWRDGRR